MTPRPNYLRVFLTFVRNSLIRDMMFPTNFIIESISSIGWVAMNLALYILIFNYTNIEADHTANLALQQSYRSAVGSVFVMKP